eukprot:2675704-Amphidinium_carterae.1
MLLLQERALHVSQWVKRPNKTSYIACPSFARRSCGGLTSKTPLYLRKDQFGELQTLVVSGTTSIRPKALCSFRLTCTCKQVKTDLIACTLKPHVVQAPGSVGAASKGSPDWDHVVHHLALSNVFNVALVVINARQTQSSPFAYLLERVSPCQPDMLGSSRGSKMWQTSSNP